MERKACVLEVFLAVHSFPLTNGGRGKIRREITSPRDDDMASDMAKIKSLSQWLWRALGGSG